MGDGEVRSGADRLYALARQSFEEGAWAQALQFAGQVLAADPMHAGAFELLTAARQRIDLVSGTAGERRLLTVLMCDLVNSTVLTQELGRDTYQDLLRAFHRTCVDAVTRYEGRIAQYRGDGVLAYFCYPQAHEDDATRAVLAALAIAEHAPRYGGPGNCTVRIGVATGPVLLGVMGAGQWTTSDMIVGDAPNLAARLQEVAQPNGVVIADDTYQLVRSAFEVRTVDDVVLKSFDAPRAVHHVVSARTDAAAPVSTAALLGREGELAALSDEWTDVLGGQPRTTAIIGDPGIGKSRLVSQVVELAIASGGRAIQMRCSSLRRHIALDPVAGAVRRLLGLDTRETALTVPLVAERLRQVGGGELPAPDADWLLAGLMGVDVAHGLLPEQIRQRTFAVLRQLLTAISTPSPLLVVVDDLQNADPSTVEFLTSLIGTMQGTFGLLVASRTAVPMPTDRTVELGPLSPHDTEALVRSLLPTVDEEGLRTLTERSDGIPLYAEQLALWAEDQGPGELPLPLDATLTARLDELDPSSRSLASTMAILGSEIRHDVLAEICAEPDVLERELSVLVARKVIEQDRERAGRAYRFRHTLIKEAAYARLPTSSREEFHRRSARSFERRHAAGEGVPRALVAVHLLAAGDAGAAVPWLHGAGNDAAANGAHREAMEHFRAALSHLDVVPKDDRAGLELALSLPYAISGATVDGYNAAHVLDAYERADVLAGTMGDSPALLGAVWGTYSFHLVRGNIERARQQGRRGERLAAMTGMEPLVGAAKAITGYSDFFAGDLTSARDALEYGLLARGINVLPHDPAIVSRVLLGVCDWAIGWPARGDGEIRGAIDEAAALDGPTADFTRAYVHAYAAWGAQLRGEFERAQAYAQRTVELATPQGFTTWIAAGWLHFAAARCQLGDVETGLGIMLPAIDGWRKAGSELMVPYYLGQLALALDAAGKQDQAEEQLDEALRVADDTGERFYVPELLRFRAALRLRSDAAGAIGDERAALREARRSGALAFELRAAVALARDGNDDGDVAHVRSLIQSWPESGLQTTELSDAAWSGF